MLPKQIASLPSLSVIALFVVFMGLVSLNQPLYPPTWFDEGLNLSTAAMLAREGLYALPDSAGPRVLDPAIQTGPTVLVPIAWVFRVWGIGLIQARWVIIVFALLALCAYALVAKRLFGTPVMGLALILLLAGNREEQASFLPMSRQVLGEVPALGMFLLGLLIWWRTLDHHPQSVWRWASAGLAWGLAMITKSQIMLLLGSCLLVWFLLDKFYYRQTPLRAFISAGAMMVACVGGWYLAQIYISGWEQFQQNAAVLREGAALHVFGLNFAHWRNAFDVIWHTAWWLWGAPALAWGVWRARQRNSDGLRQAMTLTLPVLMLVWFVCLSIGWGRYAFYTFVLSSMWVAAGFWALWQFGSTKGVVLHKLVMVGLFAVLVFVNSRAMLTQILQPIDKGFETMRIFLKTQVPADALIETWEWEFGLDARQPMHHPDTRMANIYTRYLISMREDHPPYLYHNIPKNTCYILEGPFGTWTEIYRHDLAKEVRVVFRANEYTLFQLPTCSSVIK